MRILYLTEGLPWPLTSGRLRQFHFIRGLVERGARVTLYSLVAAEEVEQADPGPLAELTDEVRLFPSRRLSAALGSRLSAAVGVMFGSDVDLEPLLSRAAEVHRSTPFDAIISARVDIPFEEVVPGVGTVIDLCDAMSGLVRGRLRYAHLQDRPWLAAQYVAKRVEERRLASHADAAVFATPHDRDLATHGEPGLARRARVVPNGVDTEYWSRRSDRLGRDTIVFTGAMDYPPNEDAATMLIEQVLPRVRAVRPAVRGVIVGRDPGPNLVHAAHGKPWVTLTGYVDDVRPFLEDAAVFVAPLRFGSGIQNKLLEAMSMSVPVVTTAIAARGLMAAGQAPPLSVGRSAAGLANLAVAALEGADEGAAPVADARDYVLRHFTWAGAVDSLYKIVDDVISNGHDGQNGDG